MENSLLQKIKPHLTVQILGLLRLDLHYTMALLMKFCALKSPVEERMYVKEEKQKIALPDLQNV